MTDSKGDGTKDLKSPKKLLVKKETLKELEIRPREAGELGNDELDAVNGGMIGRVRPPIEPKKLPFTQTCQCR
jgi:hypothetical protein